MHEQEAEDERFIYSFSLVNIDTREEEEHPRMCSSAGRVPGRAMRTCGVRNVASSLLHYTLLTKRAWRIKSATTSIVTHDTSLKEMDADSMIKEGS